MTTMATRRDDEGVFFTGYAAAFRHLGDEGVLMASSIETLLRMHSEKLGFDCDASRIRRVQVRPFKEDAV
jgi:hypothetical protein